VPVDPTCSDRAGESARGYLVARVRAQCASQLLSAASAAVTRVGNTTATPVLSTRSADESNYANLGRHTKNVRRVSDFRGGMRRVVDEPTRDPLGSGGPSASARGEEAEAQPLKPTFSEGPPPRPFSGLQIVRVGYEPAQSGYGAWSECENLQLSSL